jgi:hypothetical protein|tara:strand:- start:573 stop:746 length:174 start_codon:yes stop_codon:yes gene_type:complete
MADRTVNNTSQELIDAFFNKGGEVETLPPGARSEDVVYTGGFYGRRKKKTEDDPEKS